MSEYPILNNDPITEAILDIQTTLPQGYDFKQLESIYEGIKNEFPKKQIAIKYEALIEFKGEQKPSSKFKKEENGFLFTSNDTKKILQLRLDGFTFNKIKSYDNWESFKGEAKHYWDIYTKLTEPLKIKRIALRYINRIEIPEGQPDLREYIVMLPNIPDNIPQTYSDFFLRMALYDQDTKNRVNIIETIDNKAQTESMVPFILDIDVFKNEDLGISNDKKLWQFFDEIRGLKNDIFFNIITNKCKALFD